MNTLRKSTRPGRARTELRVHDLRDHGQRDLPHPAPDLPDPSSTTQYHTITLKTDDQSVHRPLHLSISVPQRSAHSCHYGMEQGSSQLRSLLVERLPAPRNNRAGRPRARSRSATRPSCSRCTLRGGTLVDRRGLRWPDGSSICNMAWFGHHPHELGEGPRDPPRTVILNILTRSLTVITLGIVHYPS